jgi:ABC-type glycerol-3-phosphate transport system substrate-binding protein
MGKKWSASFSLLTISAMLLVACGQKTPTPTLGSPTGLATQSLTALTTKPNGGQTRTPGVWDGTITIWHQWGGAYLAASQQIFQAYEDLHPGVTIKLVQPVNLLGVIKDAVASGQGPDIVEMTNDHIGLLAVAGAIIDLDRLGLKRQDLANTLDRKSVV